MSGSGIPTIGISPITMQILIIVETIVCSKSPTANNWLIGIVMLPICDKNRKNKIAYRAITSNAPSRPNSSQITAKIKSVRPSGKKDNLF